MKTPKHHLQLALMDCLHANLGGLNEPHTEKLQKRVAKAATKLAEKFIKLQGKEQKAAKKQAAAQQAPRNAAGRTTKRTPLLEDSRRAKLVARSPRRKPVVATTNAAL